MGQEIEVEAGRLVGQALVPLVVVAAWKIRH